MRSRSLLSLLVVALAAPPAVAAEAEVYFSPHGGAEAAVVRTLDDARSSVRVQAYSFTNPAIAAALVAAARRGVQVEVILDRSNRRDRYSAADFVVHADVPTAIDAMHAIAHNKVIIVDDAIVVTGSFNFTRQAEASNAENLLVLHDRGLAARYLANWQRHRVHSERYVGRDETVGQSPAPPRRHRRSRDGWGEAARE